MYFHVVSDGSIGNLTDAQIADQIRVLNLTFSGGEGGANTGFTFELAAVTRTDNAKWFYSGSGGAEHDMKRTLRRGGANALNLYSTTAGAYLGWAYLPSILTSPSQAYLDGVVIDWESMRGTSDAYAGQFDQGETTTHEVGHWLNLEHTFYKGCSKTRRLRRRHAAPEDPDLRVSRREGHMHGARARPDPQLHGLLLRLLLHGIHAGPVAAHERCLALLPRQRLASRALAPTGRPRVGPSCSRPRSQFAPWGRAPALRGFDGGLAEADDGRSQE